MNGRRWKLAAEWARTAFAVVAVIAAGRFAFVAVSDAMARSGGSPSTASSSSAPRGPDRGGREVSKSADPFDIAQMIGTSDTSTASGNAISGNAIRMTAMITAGPDRSEVYIDEAHVGKTPYVGDISCKSGDKVHVKIIPTQGPSIEADRPCTKGTLKVEP